ncbi:hypothetical protein PFISCL1PPCAC_28594 [Pristionchus fissidentatus]|uniref:Uncharacterized protein n=1 Tax=Pristionchus fissidentatus TaxID=1538716 RepID=A0AAV5WYL3_9BILA|nr:hypothetical protein PFISCL1PPCAC_16863 [Pristionchus fissidentatus]GMT37297.1 hypothetical protein PFISCL1PPCAC_28594 [Pristionchus fissidentatus]
MMVITRNWRIVTGRADLSNAISLVRQIVEWTEMTINDIEAKFPGVQFDSFKNRYDAVINTVHQAAKANLEEIIFSKIGDRLDLSSTLRRLASLLDTVQGRARRVGSVESIVTVFKEGSREDALLSIGRRTRTVKGKKINRAVQPSLFMIDDKYFIALCGREVSCGDNEARALFLLIGYHMLYDLSYAPGTSDVLSLCELIIGHNPTSHTPTSSKNAFDLLVETH